MSDVLIVMARSIGIYLFIILAIRLFGKKELAQLSIIDLVFILLLSNAVQNAMVGSNTSLLGGLAAASGLFLANWILKNILFRSKPISHFIQGDPLLLIYKGKVNDAHVQSAEISHEELESSIREHGIESVSDVDLAILEVDGNISVMSRNFVHRTVRKRQIHKSLGFRP